MATAAQLQTLFEPAINALGFELWGIELMLGANPRMVRIFIESEQGITVDDCAAVSRQVGATLDVEDTIPGEYRLEVSSPGMDRPLFTLEQYEQHIGFELKLKLIRAFEGRKNFRGLLSRVEGDEIVVQVDDEEYFLPVEWVERARIVPNFE